MIIRGIINYYNGFGSWSINYLILGLFSFLAICYFSRSIEYYHINISYHIINVITSHVPDFINYLSCPFNTVRLLFHHFMIIPYDFQILLFLNKIVKLFDDDKRRLLIFKFSSKPQLKPVQFQFLNHLLELDHNININLIQFVDNP